MVKKTLAAAMAMILMLGSSSCQMLGNSSSLVAQAPAQSGRKVLLDEAQSTALPEFEYPAESPAIDADLGLPGSKDEVQVNGMATGVAKQVQMPQEVKSIWISYLELDGLLRGKNREQFTQGIGKVFDNVKSFGLNTVIVQVRPFGDALYESEHFPWSYLTTGTEGKNPGFDPLQVMVDQAKSRGLRIEAWLNPYRIRAKGNTNSLSSTNQARQWLDASSGDVISYNGTVSYNPASKRAQQLIVNGAREIVRNYAVDAIHIDDYFYPTTDTQFDQKSYQAYKNGGGTKSLGDWRRSNVETLLASLYKGIKAENKDVLFGISPQSSLDNNYSAQYLDVKKIVSQPGYCDYVCPQIYFGFENEAQPYAKTLEAWSKLVTADSVKLYVGIAAYKVGAPDSWAGDGKSEWVNNSDLLARMVTESRRYQNCAGYVIYRYDSLFNPAVSVQGKVQSEAANLKSVV